VVTPAATAAQAASRTAWSMKVTRSAPHDCDKHYENGARHVRGADQVGTTPL
jgi:hypothetical protein